MDSEKSESIFKTTLGEEFTERYDLTKILVGIPRHLLLIGLTSLVGALLGGLLTYYLLTHYKAEAILVFQQDETKSLPGGIPLTNITIATAMDMVEIPANLQALKSMLGLETSLKDIRDQVDVSPPRMNSNLIRIIVKDSNPNLAMDIANSLARISVKSSQEYYKDQLKAAIYNYRDQLENVNQSLVKQMEEIEEFKKSHQYFDIDEKSSSFLARLYELRKKLQDANLQYNGLLVEYENLKREVTKLEEQSGGKVDPSLRIRAQTLETALAEARLKYSKENPKLKMLEQEFTQLKSNSGSSASSADASDNTSDLTGLDTRERLQIELLRLQGKVRSAQKIKQDLAVAMAKMEEELDTLPAEQISFARLLQNKRNLEEQDKFLNTALDTTQLLLKVPRGSLGLYQLADKVTPLKESWWVKLLALLGGLLGFGFGIGLSTFLEMKDPYFRTYDQLSKVYRGKILGVIPEIDELKPENASEETLFYIRDLTERINQTVQERKKANTHLAPDKLTLAVVSSHEDEGKSLLAYQLARYYQKLRKKVLLLETDYRGASWLSSEERSSAPLQAYLRDEANIEEVIHHGALDSIHVGKGDTDMKELVQTPKMHELWEQLQNRYDVIIVDAPGIIQDHYAVNLALYADMYVFVIGSGTSDKSTVDASLKELEQMHAHFCGFILNRVLPIYIVDKRIKAQMKSHPGHILDKLFFWKKT